jgi:hypothetical protein
MVPMPVYKEPRRNTLAGQIESVIASDRDRLIRQDLADLSFKDAEENIDRIRRFMLRLRLCDLDLLSENKFQKCNRFVSDVQTLFGSLQSFSPAQARGAPQGERNQLVQQCQTIFTESNERLVTPFAIAAPTLQETDQEVRLLLESAKANSNQVLADIKSESEKAKGEIDETLRKVRSATGAIGIEKQAEVFKNAAAEHESARSRSLKTTAGLGIATGILLLINWGVAYYVGPPSSSVALIQLTVAKLLFFSLLLSALVWSGKNYKSHQHNYVLNKHRQNALETFQLFARGADDVETKSMVLLQATKSIFSPQPTGFLSGDRDSEGDSPQILEIIRSLSSASK